MDETFTFIGEMSEKAENMFAGEVWLVGDSTMGYEMDLGFSDELNFVTILTIVAILAVVIITFHSFVSSATLVAVIQAAVYIVTAIVAVMGISVNYIALILVQCILMGSTIDYGILFISNYREMRQEKDKVEAVASAMNYSIKTIMTSSLILISCCLTVGFIMTQEIIAQTCSVIAYGALCAVILVIFLLPALAYILDRFVVKKKKEVH
jgi:Predicted exporters of the RND superfamily